LMASINSLGGKPDLSADLTIIMNRMVILLFVLGCEPIFRTISAG
jgi:hypothetical protein